MPKWLPYAVGALFAVYLPTALWLKSAYVSDVPKGKVVVRLASPFEQVGIAAISHDPGLRQLSDIADHEDVESDDRSPIVVYEGLTPLGPGHSNFAAIRDHGMGRFSHWQHQGVVFSASDNSDPSTNERKYWAVLP